MHSGAGRGTPATAAEQLISILAEEDVDHLFFNPGTDTAPVQEALAVARERMLPHPQTVLCTHEVVALSAALGHHLVTGQAQALMVHVDAGTLNLGAALHNVQRNQVPVVVMAGRSPYSLHPEVPGHRDSPIQWQQDEPDQAAAMRAYGKWTLEVPRGREMGGLVRRAFQVARTAPGGPAYLMLPREALMEPPGDKPPTLAVPSPPAPDPHALRDLAHRLAGARRPVIVTDRVGRRPQSVETLVAIADLLGALVTETRDAVNFPSRHPLYAGPKTAEVLGRGDVVLLLDAEVPWVPGAGGPHADAHVLQIDLDCVKATMPTWSYPIEVAVTADTTIALPALLAELRRLGTPTRRKRWAENRAESEAVAARLRADWADRARSEDPDDAPDAMLAALQAALPPDALTIEEAVTNKPALTRQLHRAPGRHFGVGAPALGSGLGAALGAKLADPAAPVVAITGDGAFNFGVPTAALWSAHRAGAPFVTVILDNGAYLASRRPVETLFPEGAARRGNSFPETRLGGALDYAALARACGGEGLVVERPDQMAAALERAIASTREGRCAVVDARLPTPG